jgi:nitric oxide reductase NorE protein
MTAVEEMDAAKSDRRTRIPGEEGIWVFVLGDMTVFALFFATFMYSRVKNPHIFARDHTTLLLSLGTVNTVALLSSSILVAIGVARVLGGRHVDAPRLFAGALGLGLLFVVVKVVEWARLFTEGKGVGSGEFFSYYFMFTGIHLGHVVIGLVILARLIAVSRRQEVTDRQRTFCETGGIFWHMVDLLWVVLFALFYLVR